MVVCQFYRKPGLSPAAAGVKLEQLATIADSIKGLDTEACFNVEVTSPLNPADLEKLSWVLADPFARDDFREKTFLSDTNAENIIEIGPRFCSSHGLSTFTMDSISG